MHKYKIIYCIDSYNERGGASVALLETVKSNNHLGKYMIACRNCNIPEQSIFMKTGKDVVEEYKHGDYDLIHWFKSSSFQLFKEVIDEARNKNIQVKIITTICQRPSYKDYLLSPLEIKHSLKLIFIDKAAFNDPLFSFISNDFKKMIYFGIGNDMLRIINSVLNTDVKKNNAVITYGRGSSLNKCPKDMFEIFDKIKGPKHFIIVGNGNNKWIKNEASKRNDYTVEIINNVPYKEWLKILNSFDIFLYYLPLNAYSSIDGTLGDAMLLKKAIVYFGPEAPKERLIHSYNAFVASSKEDIVKFCDTLANNKHLRLILGERARETTLKDFHISRTIENYNLVYQEIIEQDNYKKTNIKIPVTFKLYYSTIAIRKKITEYIHRFVNI